MKDWFNDSIHRCGNCGEIFKVYVLGDIREADFCPICGSCLNSEEDLTDEELEKFED